MRAVPTTAGDVDASSLGRTLVHEHARVGSEGMRFQWPHLFDEDSDRTEAAAFVRAVAQYGVETICDPACLWLHRDVRFNLALTEATGVRFVMATGVYPVGFTFIGAIGGPRMDVAKVLTECFVHDLAVGIQDTTVRAGFLKCAADAPGMTSETVIAHRAVARASMATGAPIMVHSNPQHRTSLKQIEVLQEEGIDPRKVQVAHTGDTGDLEYIQMVLDTGCYVGMDRYGALYLPDEQRNDTVAALIARGYGDRLMLSADFPMSCDLWSRDQRALDAPSWEPAHIFARVRPQLLELGVSDDAFDAMVGRNVHAWLAG